MSGNYDITYFFISLNNNNNNNNNHHQSDNNNNQSDELISIFTLEPLWCFIISIKISKFSILFIYLFYIDLYTWFKGT